MTHVLEVEIIRLAGRRNAQIFATRAMNMLWYADDFGANPTDVENAFGPEIDRFAPIDADRQWRGSGLQKPTQDG
jgi:hypothetical protein